MVMYVKTCFTLRVGSFFPSEGPNPQWGETLRHTNNRTTIFIWEWFVFERSLGKNVQICFEIDNRRHKTLFLKITKLTSILANTNRHLEKEKVSVKQRQLASGMCTVWSF